MRKDSGEKQHIQNSIELFGHYILHKGDWGGFVMDGMSFAGALSVAVSTERGP